MAPGGPQRGRAHGWDSDPAEPGSAEVGAVTSEPMVRVRLEHHSDGRVRVRVSREDRSPEQMEAMRRKLSSHPAGHNVEVNPRTGSVLLEGEDARGLEEALSEVFDVVADVAGAEAPAAGVESLVLLIKQADRRLRRTTGQRFSLRWLVPAAFIAAGIRQLMKQGLTLGTIPWYVLLYYGVDSFLKLHPEHAPRARASPGDPAA